MRRREAAHHRAFVAGGDHRDRRLPIGGERVIEEFAHLSAAFADERDDDGVEVRRAGEHRQQRRFADAGAREDADALAGAERREEVDDANAGADRLFHARAPQRWRRVGVERHRPVALRQVAFAVDRPAERVDDAALPFRTGTQRQRVGPVGARADCSVAARVERLQRDGAVLDPHDFAKLLAIAYVDGDAFAQTKEARQPGDAVVRHRNLRHDAAHPRAGQGFRGPGELAFQPIERVEALAGRSDANVHAATPFSILMTRRVQPASDLMASCMDASVCETCALTLSKFLVTSMSLDISSIGLTLEPSM